MNRREPGSERVGAVLVVGGGVGGMAAALDLAAAGIKAYVVDRGPAIGGKMSQLDKTFPTNDCAMCTLAPRLVEMSGNRDVEILTMSEVERVEGGPGAFTVILKKRPRYVDEARCTGCGACVSSCPSRHVLQEGTPGVPELFPMQARAAEEVLARYRDRRGPLMPILQELDRVLGFFPEGVLRLVAEQTRTPLTHVLEVAEFYSAFSTSPRGKHIIQLCMGTACYVKGADRVMEQVGEELGIGPGETTEDLGFTLEPVRCIGCCGLAPAMRIGDAVFGELTTRTVAEVLGRYQEA